MSSKSSRMRARLGRRRPMSCPFLTTLAAVRPNPVDPGPTVVDMGRSRPNTGQHRPEFGRCLTRLVDIGRRCPRARRSRDPCGRPSAGRGTGSRACRRFPATLREHSRIAAARLPMSRKIPWRSRAHVRARESARTRAPDEWTRTSSLFSLFSSSLRSAASETLGANSSTFERFRPQFGQIRPGIGRRRYRRGPRLPPTSAWRAAAGGMMLRRCRSPLGARPPAILAGAHVVEADWTRSAAVRPVRPPRGRCAVPAPEGSRTANGGGLGRWPVR